MAALRAASWWPAIPGLPTGTLLPKAGAALLGSNANVVLTSRRAVSEVLPAAGFQFAEASFAAALGAGA